MRKLYKKEKYDNFKEWFNNRGIGGSSASSLFGENKWQNKLDLYCAMVSKPNERDEGDEYDNESTIRGKDLEPIIRQFVAQKFGSKFKVQSPNGFTQYRRIDKPFMTATLDGILTDKDTKEKWVLEIKTHLYQGVEDMKHWDKQLPSNYFIQCCHYLATLNDFKGAILVANIIYTDYDTNLPITAEKGAGDEIRYYVIEREKFAKEIALVEEVETEFIENHVEPRIPPNFTIDF